VPPSTVSVRGSLETNRPFDRDLSYSRPVTKTNPAIL